MKKKCFVLATGLLLCCAGFSQPTPGQPPTNDASQYGIRRQTSTAPVTPATVLLLSLAGGFVGGKICRNAFSSKNRQ